MHHSWKRKYYSHQSKMKEQSCQHPSNPAIKSIYRYWVCISKKHHYHSKGNGEHFFFLEISIIYFKLNLSDLKHSPITVHKQPTSLPAIWQHNLHFQRPDNYFKRGILHSKKVEQLLCQFISTRKLSCAAAETSKDFMMLKYFWFKNALSDIFILVRT